MTTDRTDGTRSRKPLRLWPGVIAAVLLVAVRFVVPLVVPDAGAIGVLGALACSVLVLAWWLFFSRAPWLDRVLAVALIAVAVLATSRVVHVSIETGMMGMMLPLFAVPLACLGLVAAVVAGRGLDDAPRRGIMALAILLACGSLTLVRTEGVTGDGVSQLQWRWTDTPEERLLARGEALAAVPGTPVASTSPGVPAEPAPAVPAPPAPIASGGPGARPTASGAEPPEPAAPEAGGEPANTAAAPPSTPASAPTDPTPTETTRSAEAGGGAAAWPGFRGPRRDGVVRGVHIDVDWTRTPPVELWRRPVGPGWSSFAVSGDRVYTQEQRGDEEVVSCYRLATGEPVWRHRDAVRFWESNGGAGPRATPTIHDGRVYTLGATGIVNALDARTGAVAWSRNASTDTGASVPGWGFAGSPLVVDGLVVVAASGRLVAYDAAAGKPRWFGPEGGGGGYSSPHFATIGGVPQVLLLRGGGAVSVAPADGTVLWEHAWQPGVGIVQPAMAEGGDVLVTAGDAMGGTGMRRLAVERTPNGWTVEERWTSRGLKPYFNDFVVHEGHAYGFDGSILSSIDLQDGSRKWKGGRYGHGQLLLLPEQDLLLVLSEDGELALVRAAPGGHGELARVPALEGKTWNHPVLVGDVLLVRNGEEMAAFRVPLAGS